MQPEQKRFLEKRYDAPAWQGHNKHGKRVVKGFCFDKDELAGWTLHRQHEESGKPPAIRSLWHRGDATKSLLAIDLFECSSVDAALDQLIEVLGNVQSNAVERRTGKNAPGEVTFGLGETMVLFSRANIVVFIRNAGPKVARVAEIAQALDASIVRRLEAKQKDKE